MFWEMLARKPPVVTMATPPLTIYKKWPKPIQQLLEECLSLNDKARPSFEEISVRLKIFKTEISNNKEAAKSTHFTSNVAISRVAQSKPQLAIDVLKLYDLEDLVAIAREMDSETIQQFFETVEQQKTLLE